MNMLSKTSLTQFELEATIMEDPSNITESTDSLLSFDPGTNVVETHVSRLRAKVDKPFARDLIQTVRGAGYRMTE